MNHEIIKYPKSSSSSSSLSAEPTSSSISLLQKMKMLRTELWSPIFQGVASSSSSADHSNLFMTPLSSSSSITHCCCKLSFRLFLLTPKLLISTNKSSSSISCKNNSHDSFYPKSHHHQPHDDFLEASLLLSETVQHYQLRKQGFQGEVKQLPGQFGPLSTQVRGLRDTVNSIGLSILSRFRHPTMFLKISCEGDYLLPIVVGEFAIERLLDSVDEDDHGDYLNQFEFARNLVVELGYEVKMVKITKRVASTYFARVYFGKAGERETFSVDARPSDAINVAKRCKAPIYVNKDIVSADAIRIAYGTGKRLDTKPIYDVLLDSPVEGPDLLVKELNLLWSMRLAVEEERYSDAAKWRDELAKLRDRAP